MNRVCQILFPGIWVSASVFERTLRQCGDPHARNFSEVNFNFPRGCKIMLDTAVRLLSLVNQLEYCTRRVVLSFEEGEEGTLGYLNRIGFFDHLSANVEVFPSRPEFSSAVFYEGANTGLVEVARINRHQKDESLPSRLTDALIRPLSSREDTDELRGAAWTIFAELIDNVFSHSSTPLDGYAALQVYPRSNSLKVAVSDSGLGIMETLRPSLRTEFPALTDLSDIDLLVEIFRQGLSRHGTDRGCGLKGSAEKAMKYRANLDIRLPNIRVFLTPRRNAYVPATAHCNEGLPLIWGTHICFIFHLDNLK